MDNVTTRREIFGRAKKALAAAGIASQIGPAMAATPAHGNRNVEGEDYYDKLGVTKIINAAGTYTILTALPCRPRFKPPWQSRPSIRCACSICSG